MAQMYGLPPQDRQPDGQNQSGSSSDNNSQPKSESPSPANDRPLATAAQEVPRAVEKVATGAPGKILSTGGLIMSVLLSLLLGLAYVVRSLKNVKLSLKLNLKRDDRAEKKYWNLYDPTQPLNYQKKLPPAKYLWHR